VDTPSYQDILKYNMTPGDPRLKSPEYTTPDRLLFLDGTIQSVRSAERIYHEAMVHPAMFAHPSPKRVAILGGGEGATLREVLKHKTVEAAVMIEIDAEFVEIAREHLAPMSDCSDLVGRAKNCFDDELVKMYYEDGRQWFIDRYGASPTITPENKDFDVVILDALDPEDESEISDLLYNDDSFLSSLIGSLSEQGVLVIQVGTAATIDDPRPDFGIYKHREHLFNRLEASEDVSAVRRIQTEKVVF
jgi:spermidine synthase